MQNLVNRFSLAPEVLYNYHFVLDLLTDLLYRLIRCLWVDFNLRFCPVSLMQLAGSCFSLNVLDISTRPLSHINVRRPCVFASASFTHDAAMLSAYVGRQCWWIPPKREKLKLSLKLRSPRRTKSHDSHAHLGPALIPIENDRQLLNLWNSWFIVYLR